MDDVETAYYLRMQVADKPGVMAQVAGIFADHDISIEAIQQKEPEEGENQVSLILLTHSVEERMMNQAIAKIQELDALAGEVVRIRMEHLAG